MTLVEAFRNGGWGMFPTMLFGFVLLGFSVRYLMSPSKRYIPLLFSLGILTLAAGALGFVTGFIKSVDAVAQEGGSQPVLALLGAGEAANCIGMALVLIVLACLATSVGAFRLSQQAEAEG